MTILKDAQQLGRELRRPRPTAVRAQLALLAAQAVITGKWKPEDCEDVYAAYYGTGRKQGAGSKKAQVSKLHTVMLLAQDMGRPALDLLARIGRLRGDAPRGSCLPLFECMTEVARAQRKRVRPLSDEELLEVIRRRKPKPKPKGHK
jgi:hypothetical protein